MKPYNGVDIDIKKVEFWEIEFMGEKYHLAAVPNETKQEFIDRFFNKPIIPPVGLDSLTTSSMFYSTDGQDRTYMDSLSMWGRFTGYNVMDAYGPAYDIEKGKSNHGIL